MGTYCQCHGCRSSPPDRKDNIWLDVVKNPCVLVDEKPPEKKLRGENAPKCCFRGARDKDATGFQTMAASLLPTCFSSVFGDQRATEDPTCKSGTEAMADGIPCFVIQLMKSEKARLQTFSSWPFTDPQDLAEAGLFCVGRSDRVQCFCCGGTLNARDLKDNAWEEHSRSFPHCFFILGHNVGNVPLQMDEDEESGYTEKDCPPCMKTLTGRLGTFNGVQHPVDPKRLAEAGFYSTGKGDKVVCFTCGGGLENWKRQHDPFQQHARQYPGCRFLMGKKGQEFINNIQLQKHKQQTKCAVIIRNVASL
ncbi:E3 ubiquitin-protein ligase XIAP [Oryzias melastigma]|uniref:RING-type E3 ubiquitin transferase n=1 Tax=Oryzias melastigma TaxID=30732 RepID=A0A834BQ83_ORYME|nr:E3 ubiquitin-protein ligase XIAP [Oryzias melastigma]